MTVTSPPPAPLSSPFSPGELPRVLVGRVGEQARIRDHLGRVHTFGEMSGRLLVLHAPRGLGKTSLLREAQSQAAELGFVTAWLSCAKGGRLVPELVHSVHRALDTAPAIDRKAQRRWAASVSRLGVELGVAGIKVGADVDLRRSDRELPVGAVGAVEDLLHEAATLVRRSGGAGLLVLVDEVHAAPFAELAVLLNAVQDLAGARADNPLAVMAAGLPSTPEMLTRAATFGERSEFVPLDRFDADDSRLVLDAPRGGARRALGRRRAAPGARVRRRLPLLPPARGPHHLAGGGTGGGRHAHRRRRPLPARPRSTPSWRRCTAPAGTARPSSSAT